MNDPHHLPLVKFPLLFGRHYTYYVREGILAYCQLGLLEAYSDMHVEMSSCAPLWSNHEIYSDMEL